MDTKLGDAVSIERESVSRGTAAISSEFSLRLGRAVALRHTPEGTAFVAAVLDALAGAVGDPEVACRAIAWGLTDPAGSRARSLGAWLGTLGGRAGLGASWGAAHERRIAAVLAEVSCAPAEGGHAARIRARDAVRATVASFGG